VMINGGGTVLHHAVAFRGNYTAFDALSQRQRPIGLRNQSGV